MTVPSFARILVAVDDSPAALAATRAAVVLAERTGGCLRFVTVLGDDQLERGLAHGPHDAQTLAGRRDAAAAALLRHVGAAAARAGIDSDEVSRRGEPVAVLLAEARDWAADLVVLGRSDVGGTGRSYVGRVTRQVLELAEQPVLVVPLPERPGVSR